MKVIGLSSFGFEQMAGLFTMNARQRVRANLGDGAFEFEGAQAIDKAELSVWRMAILGGLKLGGDPQAAEEESSVFFAMTGEKAFVSRFVDAVGR